MTLDDDQAEDRAVSTGSALDVLCVFARLGVSCFGGPIAHIGYFRTEFVERRRWLDEAAFAELVGLCQFLPGPASSQTGFALGLMRAGLLGGLAAWIGFTLPSAALMALLAYGAAPLTGSGFGADLLHGLMLVAVAVVAQAVWGMARSLCPDRVRAGIALAAMGIVLAAPPAIGQLAAMALGALAGLLWCRDTAVATPATPVQLALPRYLAPLCLVAFVLLLMLLPTLSQIGKGGALFAAFFRAGALVFGGGHVVLPLLHDGLVTPGWIGEDVFLAGYGAAQAMPGPLFTVAAYLGVTTELPPGGIAGAALAVIAIFLPGLLLLVGILPYWAWLRRRRWARALVQGVNAAVVGLLGAALYAPIWVSAVAGARDFAVAATGFVLLVVWRVPPVLVVLAGAVAVPLLAQLGLQR